MHNGHSVDNEFSTIAHACQIRTYVYAFSWKGSFAYCLHQDSHQSARAKLVGVVATTVEAVLLQRKSVSQLSPTIKANRSYLPFSFKLYYS